MKFSVLIPVYNGENTLRRALDSVLASTHGDFELLIVDDASTDGTPDILAGYEKRDHRIRVLRHLKNQGRMQSHLDLNRAARNPYCVCVDADDEISPDFLALGAGILDKDPVDILNFPCVLRFPDGQEIFNPLPDLRVEGENMMEIFLRNDAYQGAWWSKFFRTEIFRAIEPLTTENLQADDCFFTPKLYASIKSYRYVHTGHPVYIYYGNTGQWSSSLYRMTPEKFRERCRLHEQTLALNIRFFRERGFPESYEDRFLNIYNGRELFLILQNYPEWQKEGIGIFRSFFTKNGNLLNDGSVKAPRWARLYENTLTQLFPPPRPTYSFVTRPLAPPKK